MTNLPEAFSPQLLFLDADRNTLIRRYSDTRRLHPLSSKNLSLESAIDKESDSLSRCALGQILLSIPPKCLFMNWQKCCVPACWVNVSVN